MAAEAVDPIGWDTSKLIKVSFFSLQSPGTVLLLAVQTPWENTAKSSGRWVRVDLPPP
jgi:hypothetical protein